MKDDINKRTDSVTNIFEFFKTLRKVANDQIEKGNIVKITYPILSSYTSSNLQSELLISNRGLSYLLGYSSAMSSVKPIDVSHEEISFFNNYLPKTFDINFKKTILDFLENKSTYKSYLLKDELKKINKLDASNITSFLHDLKKRWVNQNYSLFSVMLDLFYRVPEFTSFRVNIMETSMVSITLRDKKDVDLFINMIKQRYFNRIMRYLGKSILIKFEEPIKSISIQTSTFGEKNNVVGVLWLRK